MAAPTKQTGGAVLVGIDAKAMPVIPNLSPWRTYDRPLHGAYCAAGPMSSAQRAVEQVRPLRVSGVGVPQDDAWGVKPATH